MHQKTHHHPPFLNPQSQAPEALIFSPSDRVAFHDLTSSLRQLRWPKVKSAEIAVSRIIQAAWSLDHSCSMESRAFDSFCAAPDNPRLQTSYQRTAQDRRFYERALTISMRNLILQNFKVE